ncbi:MAG: hypothetical protein ACJA0V_001299 [Planctomycetota bacterium]|jgi:hypothetical protein
MNLATLLFPNGLNGESAQHLLQQAHQIRDRLPKATPGSQIAIACGHDGHAFAAALLGTWLKGHGAAIVENSLRERIMPVLDRPAVALLLHDTESARVLQVPRFLASQSPQEEPVQLPNLTASPLLTIHVQTEDGALHWCSWNADELALAIDACVGQAANAPRPAPAAQTPGLVSSMFANTLMPLRAGTGLAMHAPINARHFVIPGVPCTMTAHQALLDEVLAIDGVADAAVVCTEAGRILLGIAGPGAARIASERDDARAFEQIPRDPNGQPQIAEVFLAFGLGRTGNYISRELAWQVTACEVDTATLRTTIPTNYLFYEGHFDGYAVLAGGVQLHELILPCLRSLCGETPALNKLDSIKFLARIGPGDTIDVVLQRASDPSKLTFEVRNQDTKCTSGRLQFTAALPDLTPPTQAPTAK